MLKTKDSILKRLFWLILLCAVILIMKTGKDYYDMKKYNILRNTDCMVYDNEISYIFSFDKEHMSVFEGSGGEKCAKGRYKIVDDNKIELQFTSIYKKQFEFSQKKYSCSYKASKNGIVVNFDDKSINFDIFANYELEENAGNGYWMEEKTGDILVFMGHIMYWISNGQVVNAYECMYAKQILLGEAGIQMSVYHDHIAEFEINNSDDTIILDIDEERKNFKRKKGTYASDIVYEFIKEDFYENKYKIQPYKRRITGQRLQEALMWDWKIFEEHFNKSR